MTGLRNSNFVRCLVCLLVTVGFTLGFFGAAPRSVFAVPPGMIEVFADEDLVNGTEYSAGDSVTLAIDDLVTAISPDYADSSLADGTGKVSFDLDGIYNILPGHVVSLQGPSSLKVHTVIDLKVTTYNSSTDSVSGTTNSTGNLSVHACDSSGMTCEWDYPTVDPGGNWTADFDADIIEWYSEGTTWQADTDGDKTGKNWDIKRPLIRVNMVSQSIQGWYFNPNTVVSLEIDDPLTIIPVDYSDSLATNADGYLIININSSFTLEAGQEVEMTDGNSTKEHIIYDITVTEVNAKTEIVRGTGPHGRTINVNGWAKNELDEWVNSARYPPVDSEGGWSADFSTTPSPLDLDVGSWGSAYLADADADSTSVSWSVQSPENDYIGAPVIINTIPAAFTQDTDLVGHDTNEPSFSACGQAEGLATVWYKYIAAADGEMTLDTFGSDYNTMLGVWSGPVWSVLTAVGCNNDAAGNTQSKLNFKFTNGTTYFIGVAQKGTVETGGVLKLHVTTFADVSGDHNLWKYIEGFFAKGITTGCNINPLRYCPDQVVTRGQMAVFILRAVHVDDAVPYVPTDVEPDTFADPPAAAFMEPWIEQFYAEGYTTGCAASPLRFCPEKGITRGEMAVFLLRAKFGSSYLPVDIEPDVFVDPPKNAWMEPWIEQFYTAGYTTGCGGTIPGEDLKYCPERNAGRAEMATFIVRIFDFTEKP